MRIDFFEKGKLNFLIVVDAYSKWLEVAWGNPHEFYDQLETHVVCTLRNTGGGGFGQRATASIWRVRSILEAECSQVLPVPPYHPAYNGAAEGSAQTAKADLTKQVLYGKLNTLSMKHRLDNFLILNSTTPHIVTGQSPSELFLERQIRNWNSTSTEQ